MLGLGRAPLAFVSGLDFDQFHMNTDGDLPDFCEDPLLGGEGMGRPSSVYFREKV